MDDIITLVNVTYTEDSIGQRIENETSTDVWAHISSITRAEFFSAGEHGFKPEYVAETPIVNYSGERTAVYHGVRYTIYRTYRRDNSDTIELYLEQRVGA